MRTIRTKIYKFEELSQEAKEVAIEQYRNSDALHDVGSWAVDLFEPTQEELNKIGFKGDDFIIANNRKDIYFSTDRDWHLDCANAMEVKHENYFLKWLGIDRNLSGLGDIVFTIYTSRFRNASTTIDFAEYPSMYDNLIENATKKFDKHIQDVLKRIQTNIDYRYSDEAITEELIDNEYEFLSNGKIY